jgi:transcription elongation factor Elf1
MPQWSDGRLGMYRCPVCGYRDMIELEKGVTRDLVACSNCDTHLDLSLRGEHSLVLAVRVAHRKLPSA